MSAKSSISLVTFWISIELPRRSQKSILDCCFDWRHPLNARGTNSTKFKSFFKRLVLKWITMHDISVRVVFAGISIKKVWRRCVRFSVNANEYKFSRSVRSFDSHWFIVLLSLILIGQFWYYALSLVESYSMTKCRVALHCIALHRIALQLFALSCLLGFSSTDEFFRWSELVWQISVGFASGKKSAGDCWQHQEKNQKFEMFRKISFHDFMEFMLIIFRILSGKWRTP